MSQSVERPAYGEGKVALMSAVIQVAAKKGLRGVTYRTVAKAAGMNHNLITYHFGSMDGLLSATMKWAIESSIEHTKLEILGDPDKSFADILIASVMAEPEVHMFQFEMLFESRHRSELREPSRLLYATYSQATKQAVARRGLIADDAMSRTLFAALDGLMLQLLTVGDVNEIRASVSSLERLIDSVVLTSKGTQR